MYKLPSTSFEYPSHPLISSIHKQHRLSEHSHLIITHHVSIIMKASLITTLVLSFALSTIAHPDVRNAEVPRELPNELASLMSVHNKLSVRDIQKRDACIFACNSGCGYCSSQGCLANCQLNW